jgi:HAD superfamily hydrolase (TIGR01509 family)
LTSKIKAVVFDLDATLVNLGGQINWRHAHDKVVKSYINSGCNKEFVKSCSSKGLFTMLDIMRESLEQNTNLSIEIQKKAYEEIERFEINGTNTCSLMPGCLDTLKTLYDRGLLLGICTSNSTKAAKKALMVQNISHYFTSVIGREYKYRMKPHPDQLLACFNELLVEPKQGVMVGDSHKDILAGKVVGSYTVAIPVYFTNMDKLMDSKPDIIINNLMELPKSLDLLK